MVHLIWKKFVIKKEDAVLEITSRKIANAKRALEKERQKAGLFGEELMSFKSVEERFEIMKLRKKDFVKNMRDFEAQTWRDARKLFRSFNSRPEIQEKIADYWNKSKMPKDPIYLIGVIHTTLYRENLATSRVRTFPPKIEKIDGNK